jgi:drug/metabolite transporter (DMT)-like permease
MGNPRDEVPGRLARRGSTSAGALAFAAAAVALWSTNALVGKSLLQSHPVSQVQFLQFSGAALVFAGFRLASACASRNGAASGSADGRMALAAAFGVGLVGLVGTMVLQYVAFASMPVIEANLVAYTWPLMVAASAMLLHHPRRPVLLGLAAIVGFAGVVLVISAGRAPSLFQGHLPGCLAAFGSALCMAFYSVMIGRVASSPDRLLLPSSLIGVGLTSVWCIRSGFAWPGGVDLLLGLYLGAGPIGLGYYFWSQALKYDGSGAVAVVAYLTPVASTLLLTLSGDRLTAAAIAGAILVIGSCIVVGAESLEAENHV